MLPWLAMWMANPLTTCSVLGLNLNSYDFDRLFVKLNRGGKYLAGDFGNWDGRFHKDIHEAVIDVMYDFSGVPDHKEMHKYASMYAPINVLDKQLVAATQKSGWLFTTPENSMGVELCFRYAYRIMRPDRNFAEDFSIVCMGDDHILGMKPGLENIIPAEEWKNTFASMGMVYTAADKSDKLSYNEWDELTFCGATPVKVGAKYCGRVSEKTLQEMCHWQKGKVDSIEMTVDTCVRLASIYPEPVFREYRDVLTKAMDSVDRPLPAIRHWQSTRTEVAEATGDSGSDFLHILCEGNNSKVVLQAEGPTNKMALPSDLTKIQVPDVSVNSLGAGTRGLANKALTEMQMDSHDALKFDVLRTTFDWKESDPTSNKLFSVRVPYGILELGEANLMQNIPFKGAPSKRASLNN